jgi:hypothetical protein
MENQTFYIDYFGEVESKEQLAYRVISKEELNISYAAEDNKSKVEITCIITHMIPVRQSKKQRWLWRAIDTTNKKVYNGLFDNVTRKAHLRYGEASW